MRDLLRRQCDRLLQILHRLRIGGHREPAVDQGGQPALDEIQVGDFVVPRPQDVIGVIELRIVTQCGFGVGPHLSGVFQFGAVVLKERESRV